MSLASRLAKRNLTHLQKRGLPWVGLPHPIATGFGRPSHGLPLPYPKEAPLLLGSDPTQLPARIPIHKAAMVSHDLPDI